MKKLLCIGLLLINSSIFAIRLTNVTKFPVSATVTYYANCTSFDPLNTVQYKITVPSHGSADITQASPVVAREKGCNLTVMSVEASLLLSDGITQLKRTFVGPFTKDIVINSSLQTDASFIVKGIIAAQ